MPLNGRSFLALWNDITRGREAEYDHWHTLEHVPERVSVSGFHGARRYVNRQREDHRYFTIYDVESVAVFDSPEYRDLLAAPTPWTRSMRPDFNNFARAICSCEMASGIGIGAAVACLCVPEATADDALRSALADQASQPGVTAVAFGRRVEAPSAAPLDAAASQQASLRAFDRVALIEALDRGAAVRALADALLRLDLQALPRDFGADVYDLAFVFPGADPNERLRHRRPQWGSTPAEPEPPSNPNSR